jgi:hypothetical protein
VQRDEKHNQNLFEAIGHVGKGCWIPVVGLLGLFRRLALDMSTSYLLGKGSDSQLNAISKKEGNQTGEKQSLFRWVKGKMTYDDAYEVVRPYLSWRSKLGSLYWLADGIQVSLLQNASNTPSTDLDK